MLPSAPDHLQAFVPVDSAPSMPPRASQAPPLGVRPLVDRFGKPAGEGGEPVIAPGAGIVAPLRDGLGGLKLGRLARPGRLPLGVMPPKRA